MNPGQRVPPDELTADQARDGCLEVSEASADQDDLMEGSTRNLDLLVEAEGNFPTARGSLLVSAWAS